MLKTKKRNEGDQTKHTAKDKKKCKKATYKRKREKNTANLCGEMQCWFEMTASSLCAGSSNPPHPTLLSTGFPTYITHSAAVVAGCSPRTAHRHRHYVFPFTHQLKLQLHINCESGQTDIETSFACKCHHLIFYPDIFNASSLNIFK